MKNLTVRTRLLAGFMMVALMGALVAAVAIFNMAKMNDHADSAYARDLKGVSHTKEAHINLILIGRAIRGLMLSADAPQRQQFTDQVAKARSTMLSELNNSRPLFVTAGGKALFAEVDRAVAEYDTQLTELNKMAHIDGPEATAAAIQYAFTTYSAKANQLDDKLAELSKQKDGAAAASAAGASSVYDSTRMLMLLLALGALIVSVGLGLWITRGLELQLGGEPAYAAQVVAAIAAGDLSTAVATRAGDKTSLLFAMETMRASLVNIVRQVREGTDTIATASNEIAMGNLDLSSRTEQQASSLEETASSMEELTGTVKQNADNAHQANTLAVSASEVAVKGGAVVSKVVDTMASINESSKKIVDIIGVIDGIAFQTNILALNAAVEAARAGEQGRGFAVVATEVRNLAQRSAAAAKEIKTLINDSVEKVASGGKLVDEAGATMDEIVQSIARVTDIMAEIASASVEQTSGIEQVNTAITEMDEVTQQNAALVEEAAAAAGSLQDQAVALAEVVGVFKLDQAAPAGAPRLRPVAATSTAIAPARPAAPRKLAQANGADQWEAF